MQYLQIEYKGKSHLASVRICGDKAYNIRSPMYDSDKVRTDINLLSWYLRHPEGKREKKVAHTSGKFASFLSAL